MKFEEEQAGFTVTTESEIETDRLGLALAGIIGPNTVVGLVGDLGAGKTRLVRALAEGLGVAADDVSSPTYVLIHEYEGKLPVYHFDAYRLGGPEPFEALGVAEYWRAGGVCLVEWADLVEGTLPDDAWWIRIEPIGPRSRRFQVAGPIDVGDVARLKHAMGEV